LIVIEQTQPTNTSFVNLETPHTLHSLPSTRLKQIFLHHTPSLKTQVGNHGDNCFNFKIKNTNVYIYLFIYLYTDILTLTAVVCINLLQVAY